MQDRIASAKGGQQAAQTALAAAQEAQKKAAAAADEKRAEWDNARTAAGFAADADYQAACIAPEDRQRRQTAVIQHRTDTENARAAYAENLAQINGRERPDINGIKKLLEEADSRRENTSNRIALAVQSRSVMEKDAKELAERSRINAEKRVQADELVVFAKRMRGDFSISLQRYVLGVMLTSITAAANRLLKTVYAGRYQLYRTNEAAGNNRKRGLELEVYDANNNERRSVTTLSGGEKFLVALSLAIGLSTVVQAQGGGVRLEAMFIDEGFGSLDRESVNDALEVLQGIRRSSGLVGIISHVDQLAETIPAKIQITKRRTGSSCEVIC